MSWPRALRAERAGYEAIVITLDTTLLGWRVRDLDRGYLPFLRWRGIANYTSDPVFRRLRLDSGAAPSPPRPGLGVVKSVLELLRSFPGGLVRALSSGARNRCWRTPEHFAAYGRDRAFHDLRCARPSRAPEQQEPAWR
jgi:lactate 2-monooxygenase